MQGVSRTSATALADRVDALGAGLPDPELTRLGDDLFAVVHLLASEASLRRVLSDPALVPEQKAGLVQRLFATQVQPPAAEALGAAVQLPWSAPSDLVESLDAAAAQALFVVAERSGRLDDVEDELFRFGRIVDREPGLRSALTDPALPGERKATLLAALLEGRVTDTSRRLIREVIVHPRGRTLDRGLDAYGRAAAARRDRLVGRVRVAVPLTDEQTQRLAAALASIYGRPIHLNVEIDPSIVGGLSVRVGDEVFDGTIVHRLAEARRRLAG